MENANLNINIEQTTAIKCDECGNEHFHEVLYMRKLSAILSPTGQPAVIPIPVFACTQCNHVNDEFKPKELK